MSWLAKRRGWGDVAVLIDPDADGAVGGETAGAAPR